MSPARKTAKKKVTKKAARKKRTTKKTTRKKATRKKAAGKKKTAKKTARKKAAGKKTKAKKAPKKPAAKPKVTAKAASAGKKKASGKTVTPKAKKARKKPRPPAKPPADAHPKLGVKHTCFACEAKFYDLFRPEPLCPKCGADQRETPKITAPKKRPAKPRRRRSRSMAPLYDDEEEADPAYGEDNRGLDNAQSEAGFDDPAKISADDP
jgi:hypothetical protein